MAYTEIKERNRRKYYYRVISVRKNNKVKKNRVYLGVNLAKEDLLFKEIEADKEMSSGKIEKNIKEIKFKIIPILRRNKIKKAGIFGSYAKGRQNKNSDVDIIVEPPKGIGFGFVRIAYDLEKALNKKVDLLTYKGINPLLKKRILGEEVRII